MSAGAANAAQRTIGDMRDPQHNPAEIAAQLGVPGPDRPLSEIIAAVETIDADTEPARAAAARWYATSIVYTWARTIAEPTCGVRPSTRARTGAPVRAGANTMLAPYGLETNSTLGVSGDDLLHPAALYAAIAGDDTDTLRARLGSRDTPIRARHYRPSAAINATSEPDPDREHTVRMDCRSYIDGYDNGDAERDLGAWLADRDDLAGLYDGITNDGYHVIVDVPNRAAATTIAAAMKHWVTTLALPDRDPANA